MVQNRDLSTKAISSVRTRSMADHSIPPLERNDRDHIELTSAPAQLLSFPPIDIKEDVWDDAASSGHPMQPTSEPPQSLNHPATQPQIDQWSGLPHEIKGNVLELLGRTDLRCCRLVDQITSVAATRVLFRTVCVSPSMNSMDRLEKISLQPALANSVRVIVVQTHYLVSKPFDSFVDFPGPLAFRLRRLEPLDAVKTAFELSREYAREQAAEGLFFSSGPSLLSTALKRLPLLRHLVHIRPECRTATGDYLLDADTDLWWRTGVSMLDRHRQYPLMHSVLQKCRHLKPISLNFTSLYWWEFYNISQIPHLREMFSKVKTFKFSFQVDTFDRPTCRLNQRNAHWDNGLTRYIKNLPSYLPEVESLWLGFDSTNFAGVSFHPVCNYAVTRMSALFLQTRTLETPFPKLTTLTLENMVTNPREVCRFLLHHDETLKHLTICNMRLDDDPYSNENAGISSQMILLIKLLHHNLHLDKVSLQGFFRGAPEMVASLHSQRGILCAPLC